MPEFKNKQYIILICVALCIIPPFFGVFTELIFVNQLNMLILLLISSGISALYLIGKAFENFAYNSEALKIMENHDLISALIHKNDKETLLIFFPLTMVMEELIFRYYSIGILYNIVNLGTLESIVISSFIFSVYHIHFWFKYKNKRIMIIYIIYSFFLGLLNGFVILTIGLLFCILIHYLLAFILYFNISKKITNRG